MLLQQHSVSNAAVIEMYNIGLFKTISRATNTIVGGKIQIFFYRFSFFFFINSHSSVSRSFSHRNLASTFIHSINANKIDTKLELMSQFPPLNYNCKSAK